MAAAALAALVAALPAGAQLDDQPFPLLLTLGGDTVTVRYSPGSLARASVVQDRFEGLSGLFGDWAKRRVPLLVIMLSPEEWQTSGLNQTYGIPSRVLGVGLAVPAWGNEETVELWGRRLGGALDTGGEEPLRGTREEAASLVPTDWLALVEASRILLQQGEYRGTEAWVDEVVAHSLALSTLFAFDPGALPELRAFYERVGAGAERPFPLAAYKAGLSLDDWLWFQARFFEGARLLAEEKGPKSARGLLKLIRKQQGVLTAEALLEWSPGLPQWMQAAFAPPPG